MTEDRTSAVRGGHTIRRSRWLAITGLMSALALLGNYVLVGLPNVEMGSSILFVTAYIFGFYMAMWCTLIMSTIYGMFNPWGGLVPQIWISQVIGWLFVGAAGAIMGRNGAARQGTRTSPIEFGLVGAITTLFFDLVTDLGYSWAIGVPYYVALALGLPFMVVHVVSNFLIFLLVVPVISRAIEQTFGEVIWGTTIKDTTSLGEG